MGSLSTGTTHDCSLALPPSVMPQPPFESHAVTSNSFQDRRLGQQIKASLSSVVRPRSHATWKASQEVIHPKIAPRRPRLTMEFLKVDSRKERCTFVDMSSHFDPFKLHFYIAKCAPFFSGSLLLRTSQLSVLAGEKSWDGWPPGKFLKHCVSEDEARPKDLW